MRKMVLTTVGTSLLNHLAEKKTNLKNYIERIEGKPSASTKNYDEEYKTIKKESLSYLKNLNLDKSTDLDKSSAEIKSLVKLGINQDDEVYLFTTETIDGKLCAEILNEFIKEKLGCEVKIEEIKGLQVGDFEIFKKEGIKNFIDRLTSIIDNPNYRYGSEMILNITGGFKAVIPYTTILGMMKFIKVVYIFEDTQGLLELPPLPITYNKDFLQQHKSIFDRLAERTIVPISEFKSWLKYDDEEFNKCSAMIEEDGRDVMFSTLGEYLYKQFLEDTSTKIYLSKKAKNVFDSLTGEYLSRIEGLFEDLRNSQRRQQLIHKKFESFETDCLCLKKPHTAERIFFFEDDKHIKIVEIFLDHNEYETYIKNNSILKQAYKDFVLLE